MGISDTIGGYPNVSSHPQIRYIHVGATCERDHVDEGLVAALKSRIEFLERENKRLERLAFRQKR